jgi:hypothetical protein
MNSALTITIGDWSQNRFSSGLTLEDLIQFKRFLINCGYPASIYSLNDLLESKSDPAYLLFSRGGVSAFGNPDLISKQLKEREEIFAKKAFLYGREVNRIGFWSLFLSDEKVESRIMYGGKSTYDSGSANWKEFPEIEKVKRKIEEISCRSPMSGQVNWYYDVSKCGLGFHGDSERSVVFGIRLGNTNPMDFSWFEYTKGEGWNKVGKTLTCHLSNGDFYILSSKAVGTDHKKPSASPVLKHAVGCQKYRK